MNTTKKINSLLSSGAVSMTGPTQTRIVKQSPQQQQHHHHQQLQQHQQKQHLVSSSSAGGGSGTTTVQYMNHAQKHCYVCDDPVHAASGQVLTDAVTTITNTKVPNKIGRVVGDAFMVIISVDDVVCKRCMSMFNHMDRLENDLERVKVNVLNLINKKYGIQPDDKLVSTTTVSTPTQQQQQPPHKVQRLNTSQTLSGGQRKTSNGADATGDEEVTVTRKITTTSRQVVVANDAHDLHQHQNLNSAQVVQRQGTTITPVSNATAGGAAITTTAASAAAKKPGQTTKIYKCMSCDFKTVDLKQFQPHYETCKQQNAGYRCKLCKKLFTNMNALKVHTAEKHANAASIATGADFVCSICNINYVNEPSLRKHMETNHPDVKTIESAANATNVTATTTATTTTQQQQQQQQQQQHQQQQQTTVMYQCGQCQYKTADKLVYDEHQRKHQAKVKPFKCRLCAQRFETRDQASVHAKTHQPDYFKCGKCAMSFPQREMLMRHFDTHKTPNQQQQLAQQQKQQQQQQAATAAAAASAAAAAAAAQQQELTTQKLLQETIDEALRDTGEADSKIHFFSCNICSLTFIQENYYNQHMETHKRETKKPLQQQHQQQQQQEQQQQQQQQHQAVVAEAATIQTQSPSSLIKQEVRNTNATILHSTQSGQISDADIESMFEKMHSDKPADGQQQSGNENMVITSQGTTAGGISFSISIPQGDQQQQENIKIESNATANNGDQQQQRQSIGIDMPMLTDQADEHHQAGASVSMPSLDDDGSDAAAQQQQQQQQDHHDQQQHQQAGAEQQQQQQQHMDLEEMQNAAESGHIKFILNEDGQILQLDNHIITTDADGNQILVQGADSEQIQQLLQQVGVLQGDGGDGETFQMIQGENNQMIFVQGGTGGQAVAVGGGEHAGGETHQLIDASMLNEDGHLVLQPGEELPEGMHVVGADGVHVPVSIAYAQNDQQQEAEQHQQQQEQHDEAQQLQQQLEDQHQQQQLDLEQQQQEHDQAQQAHEQGEEASAHSADATEEAAQQQQQQQDDADATAVAEPSNDMIDIEDQIDAVCIATTIGQEQINAALAAAQTTTAGGLAATTVVTAEGTGAPVVTATTASSTETASSDGGTSTTVTLGGQPNVSSTTGEVFFNLEDLMQHTDEPSSKQQAEQSDADQQGSADDTTVVQK